jgi:hypothetical protein
MILSKLLRRLEPLKSKVPELREMILDLVVFFFVVCLIVSDIEQNVLQTGMRNNLQYMLSNLLEQSLLLSV